MFCSEFLWKRLNKVMGDIYAANSFDLALVATNPTARCKKGFTSKAFAETLKKAAGDIPVVDVVQGIIIN